MGVTTTSLGTPFTLASWRLMAGGGGVEAGVTEAAGLRQPALSKLPTSEVLWTRPLAFSDTCLPSISDSLPEESDFSKTFLGLVCCRLLPPMLLLLTISLDKIRSSDLDFLLFFLLLTCCCCSAVVFPVS